MSKRSDRRTALRLGFPSSADALAVVDWLTEAGVLGLGPGRLPSPGPFAVVVLDDDEADAHSDQQQSNRRGFGHRCILDRRQKRRYSVIGL